MNRRCTPSSPRRSLATAALWTALGLGSLGITSCGSLASEDELSVAELINQGRFADANRQAAAELESNPNDSGAREQFKQATIAFLLYQGTRAFYDDEIEIAEEAFGRAAKISAEVPQVQAWQHKVNEHLADKLVEQGRKAYIDEDYGTAQVAYEAALEHRPGDTEARWGLGRIFLLLNHHQGLGDDYYNEGVRNLEDYWLYESINDFNKAGKYVRGQRKLLQRTEQVNDLLAGRRVSMALNLEANGNFAAARNEFKFTLTLEPENEEALAGLARTALEADAYLKLEEARMLTLRKRYTEAYAALDEGEALTLVQVEKFEAARAGVDEARLREGYNIARNLEADYLYEEAIVAYTRLLDETTYYEDAIARRGTLTEFVEQAEELYAEFEIATDDAEKKQLLRQIELFWPEYLDIQEQLEALKDV